MDQLAISTMFIFQTESLEEIPQLGKKSKRKHSIDPSAHERFAISLGNNSLWKKMVFWKTGR